MKKISCLCVSLILLLCSACGNTESARMATENHQVSTDVSSLQNADMVSQNQLTYSI